MEKPVRVRLEFEDHRSLLSRSQRKDGLRRCWILLGPHLDTVADVAAHIVRSFAIGRSCPHGIIIYLDEFVLPPFESTSIFRDGDIIMVRKKAGKQKQLPETCDDAYCIQDSDNVAKECELLNDNLLHSQDFHVHSRANKRKRRVDICDIQQITSTHAVMCDETKLKRKRPYQPHANGHTSWPKSHVNAKEKKGTLSSPQPVGQIAVAEDEFVPITVRSGHIHPEPIDGEWHKSLSKKAVAPPQFNGVNQKGENESELIDVDVGMQGYGIKEAALDNTWESAISEVNAKHSATHVTELPPSDSFWGEIDKNQLQQNGWDSWIANKTPPNTWSWAAREKMGTAWSTKHHKSK
ncbi:coilin-like isoform X2 [Canna indica]|uniref:Coilin-like isoform X2 n=1 Tax=Canna indica TaxID=4628 RepID=A0AAQ3KVK5_9LILI|nr:coilin-like isoform X2 [Canna indica]